MRQQLRELDRAAETKKRIKLEKVHETCMPISYNIITL